MERMHEIMKERLEADTTLSEANEVHSKAIDKLNLEMALKGPFKIGDIVVTTGYSFKGKNIIVDHIFIRDNWEGCGVLAKGRILKDDGTPGLRMGECFIEIAVAP